MLTGFRLSRVLRRSGMSVTRPPGSGQRVNAQPIVVRYSEGDLAIVHNGNLTNALTLKAQLVDEGAIFQSSSDSEVIVHLIARSRHASVEAQLRDALNFLEGAYSLVITVGDTMFAVRDPRGFRPLVMGKIAGGHVVASETCALDIMGAEFSARHQAGRARPFPRESSRDAPGASPGDAGSVYFRAGVLCATRLPPLGHERRPRAQGFRPPAGARAPGRGRLCHRGPPTAPNSAALGYSEHSNTPYELGLLRNHYVGRTFIRPSQADRDFGARIKYNPVREVLDGQRVCGRRRLVGSRNNVSQLGEVHSRCRSSRGAPPHRQPSGALPVFLRHRHALAGRASGPSHVGRAYRVRAQRGLVGLSFAGRVGPSRLRGRPVLQRLFFWKVFRPARGLASATLKAPGKLNRSGRSVVTLCQSATGADRCLCGSPHRSSVMRIAPVHVARAEARGSVGTAKETHLPNVGDVYALHRVNVLERHAIQVDPGIARASPCGDGRPVTGLEPRGTKAANRIQGIVVGELLELQFPITLGLRRSQSSPCRDSTPPKNKTKESKITLAL